MFGIPEKHIDQLEKEMGFPEQSLIEECSELIQILAKYEGERISYNDVKNRIIEEMSDILVSMNLVARNFDINENDIRKRIFVKAILDDFDTDGYFEKGKR